MKQRKREITQQMRHKNRQNPKGESETDARSKMKVENNKNNTK